MGRPGVAVLVEAASRLMRSRPSFHRTKPLRQLSRPASCSRGKAAPRTGCGETSASGPYGEPAALPKGRGLSFDTETPVSAALPLYQRIDLFQAEDIRSPQLPHVCSLFVPFDLLEVGFG